MRVAILGPFNVMGGVSTVVEEMALAFLRRGDNITVITLEFPKKNLPLQENLCIFASSKESKLISFKTISNIIYLVNFLRQKQYDIVISNLYYSSLLPLLKGCKKVHILHGMGSYSPNISGWLRAKVGNYSNILGWNLADTVIANSYLTAAINSSIFGINSTVVPLGVSLPVKMSHLNEDNRDIDLLYVGRLNPFKMIPVVLESLALLSKQQGKNINFHIVGEGSEENQLKLLAKQLDIEEQVVFHGYTPREQLGEYYARSRCLISLNPTEPFGLTYLEALVHGTPVILCRGSGFSPFCDHRFACLVDLYPQSVAEGIYTALNTEWDRTWISKYILETFSWDRVVDSILKTI
jgi:glycosyltransferase involved in cell wall biosynthesis